MDPDEIIACLARHRIVFDSPVTTEQILNHFKGVPQESHIVHLLALLAWQVTVRNLCGSEPITTTPPYP
jgi:hypothetical protein